MINKHIYTCIASLSISASAYAHPINIDRHHHVDVQTSNAPAQYTNETVIRIFTSSQKQLKDALDLTRDVWSERIGVGELVVQIHKDNLDDLTAIGVHYNVIIDDLQLYTVNNWNRLAQTDRQLEHIVKRHAGSVHNDAWFGNYKQLDEISSYINNIVNLRPDLASTEIIGQSYEGRDIFSITITGPETPENIIEERPAVFIFSAVHAREWIAPMTTTYFASKFVQEYDTDERVRDILDQTRIIIVPVGNPDGYLYTWSNSRFWRNTRRPNGDGTIGVNINRNWGYEWGNQGSSSNTSSTNYRGTEPFSEPETRALRDVALGLEDHLVAHIDYHSFSQLILWPFGYNENAVTPEPYRSYFDELSTAMSDEMLTFDGTRYVPQQSIDLYPAAGLSTDWFFGELGVTSFTLELRPDVGGFDPPPAEIFPNAQENYIGFKYYIERALTPLYLTHQSPVSVRSGTPTTFTLSTINQSETIIPSSVEIYIKACADCSFEPTNMVSVDPSIYETEIAGLSCGAENQYYFQVQTQDGNTYTLPEQGADAPFTVFSEDFVTAYADAMEGDSGWTIGSPEDKATSGIWTRMNPQGSSSQPEDDHTPTGTDCWITDGVVGIDPDDRDVDGGMTTLTTPIFDGLLFNNSGNPELIISFWYAIKTEFNSNFDGLRTEISNDGGQTWVPYVTLGNTNRAWNQWTHDASTVIEPTENMRMRFRAIDDRADHVVEVAIDDFRVENLGCAAADLADLNNDGTLNFFDVSIFLEGYHNRDTISDINRDGIWNYFDVSEFVLAFLTK